MEGKDYIIPPTEEPRRVFYSQVILTITEWITAPAATYFSTATTAAFSHHTTTETHGLISIMVCRPFNIIVSDVPLPRRVLFLAGRRTTVHGGIILTAGIKSAGAMEWNV